MFLIYFQQKETEITVENCKKEIMMLQKDLQTAQEQNRTLKENVNNAAKKLEDNQNQLELAMTKNKDLIGKELIMFSKTFKYFEKQ